MYSNNRAKKQQLVRPDAGFELASLAPSQIAAKWDKASKLQRCDILSSFVERYHSNTAAEIERTFGGSAQLFFARVTASLRLSYKNMAASCDRFGILMLMTIGLFLQGQKFLTSYAEVGGIQLLCDFVASIPNCGVDRHEHQNNNQQVTNHNNNNNSEMNPSFTAENNTNSKKKSTTGNNNQHELQATIEAAAKTRAIRLLIHIANSGRVYREMICEDGGLQHLVNATTFETDDGVLELTGSLFLSLGHGNPRRVRDVHGALLHIARTGNDSAALCAASTLRALQVARIGPLSLAATQISSPHQQGGGSESENNNKDHHDGTTSTTTRSNLATPSSSSKVVGVLLPENNNNASSSSARTNFATTASSEFNDDNNNGHDEVPPHLAGAVVSPVRLSGPTPSATAAQNAETEAGLALYMDSLFHLLRSPSIRVRFEGIELLTLSAPGQGILEPMLKRIIDILDDVDTTLHAISALPYERERAFIHLHASCVRLLYALLTHKDEQISIRAAKIFDNRLLHLCLGRFIRVTQEAHSRSVLSQSFMKHVVNNAGGGSPGSGGNNNNNNYNNMGGAQSSFNSKSTMMMNSSLLRNTAAPTAAPGVQDAVRILKALLTGEGFADTTLALEDVDRLRKTVESWLRKTLEEDELFAPLLDTSSSLNDSYVIAIAQKLSEANRQQLEKEEKIDENNNDTSDAK